MMLLEHSLTPNFWAISHSSEKINILCKELVPKKHDLPASHCPKSLSKHSPCFLQCSNSLFLSSWVNNLGFKKKINKNSQDKTKLGAFILTYCASPSAKCYYLVPKYFFQWNISYLSFIPFQEKKARSAKNGHWKLLPFSEGIPLIFCFHHIL